MPCLRTLQAQLEAGLGEVFLMRRLYRLAPVLLLATSLAPAGATEDTDTPGAGKWEINIGVSGERSGSTWEYAVPDTDFNYGWGDNTQLVLAVPRILLHEPGVGPRSGLGSATVGIKWRLFEHAPSGIALAVFPTYSWNLSSNAARRGLADPGRSVALPLMAGVRRGDTALFAEAGRNLVQYGPDEWLAGLRLTHQCLAALECRVELDHTRVAREPGQTLASVGFKWKLAEDLILQGSVGRDVGPAREDGRQLAFMFGVQLLR
jgi:hypothetical protein